jgi:hypothetical protein
VSQAKKPLPKPSPKPAFRRSSNPIGSVDAMSLSDEDYRARLAQLGLKAPTTERSGAYGVGVPLEQREAQRDAHRQLDRQHARAERLHGAQEDLDCRGDTDVDLFTDELVRGG